MISLKKQPDGAPVDRKQAVPSASSSRIVPKPVPEAQVQDPRGFQIEQLKRRFSPKESTTPEGDTSLVFKLKPSDPDFPFELPYLDCDVRIPEEYPEERPVLLVRNKDIPKGFSINIERGWDKLAEEKKSSTLLALVYALDRNLERFLSEQKVDTIKLVSFKDTRHLDQAAGIQASTVVESPMAQKEISPAPSPRRYIPEPSYTREQIAEAKTRRAQEIRQLEARMGRMAQFRRSGDGVIFTLPMDPKRRAELPSGLHSVNSIHLIIPLLYPLQQLRVQLNEANAEDAEPIEDLFAEKAAEQKQMTLMSHVNYLAQNLHNLAKQAHALAAKAEKEKAAAAAAAAEAMAAAKGKQPQGLEDSSTGLPRPLSNEKGHIQVIPRPPEWNVGYEDDELEDSYSDSDDAEEGGAVLGGEDDDARAPPSADEVEHGTMISFPNVELHSIELLQISLLSLSVKCERCKTLNDITGLKPSVEKASSCKKCATPLSAKFNQQLVHEYSARAGFIDLSGCKVADMLPSTFVPTCAKCSTPSQGLVSVRGETTANVCRECHSKFTFKIPEVKFLFVSPGSLPPPAAGMRRKQEKLGLHAGDQLPERGTCTHYRKSYRWFRFSCCNRVYKCDKCHDQAEDHINEWANRMICGFCSREQNYAVEACRFCGRSVIGRRGKGFWEGGKGNRDKITMRKKDPRKYKRIGTSAVAKKD
ncbi:hypothetical protein ACSS6W_001354 [Trichoderma asperelloides]|uniref:Uncharacterized protein C18H10.09 n=1 Tax=Trichoderma asperellum TaxID=101201 RepID=A0A6V8QMQ7_TRIAP|nr:hypothetical protein LI328DRAFT_132526 [Trichoderma asperelloides]GFP53760.1 uncharacterized protein C18H10.09 [Trichoderma asperellum]